jgi:hypothetical protein
VSTIPTENRRKHLIAGDAMTVSLYDRVSGMLVVTLIFVGFFVLVMFLIWLTHILNFREQAVKVTLIEPFGRGEAAEGYERDIEEPGLEEIEEFTEPRIEETFEAITDTITTNAASLMALNTGETSSSHGSGMGDSRGVGPGGEGDGNVVPRVERWRISLKAANINAFASQLDFFGIEIGALGGGISTVDYASGLSGSIKKRRVSGGGNEKRLFFHPEEKVSEVWTRQLLEKAGFPVSGRVILHFYPRTAENQLATAENNYLKKAGKSLPEVRRTYFAVRGQGGGFQFFVVRQEYRTVFK